MSKSEPAKRKFIDDIIDKSREVRQARIDANKKRRIEKGPGDSKTLRALNALLRYGDKKLFSIIRKQLESAGELGQRSISITVDVFRQKITGTRSGQHWTIEKIDDKVWRRIVRRFIKIEALTQLGTAIEREFGVSDVSVTTSFGDFSIRLAWE